MPALITLERITEIVMLARTNGYAGHTFTGHAAGGFSLIWSNACYEAVLTFGTAAGKVDQVLLRADTTVAAAIWQAIADRAGQFTPELARAVGETRNA